jgi:hypothetical protein
MSKILTKQDLTWYESANHDLLNTKYIYLIT